MDCIAGDPPGMFRCQEGDDATDIVRLRQTLERLHAQRKVAASAVSMIASTGAVALLPAYPNNLLPWSVTSRPLKGEHRLSIWSSDITRRTPPQF